MPCRRPLYPVLLLVCLAAFTGPSASSLSAQVRGPAGEPPVAPATVARDDHGQATIRAVRIERPIELDGRLDEAIYQETPPIDGFIQQEPSEGAPASENTHVWVLFDDRNVYVSARCFDSDPARDVITE